MATPAYIGSGQPTAGKSIWSGLTSWFGGAAPAYKPAASSTSPSASSTTTPGTNANASSSAQPTRVIVIVPHGGFIPACEWPDPQQ
jgi:hypothetical protein